MTVLSPARRVASFDDLAQAGDYSGPHPVLGYPEGARPTVWFLLPIHTGPDMYGDGSQGSGLHGATEPPWMFRECPDGSLEIRESIGCGDAAVGYYWHGYLDEGNTWRQV